MEALLQKLEIIKSENVYEYYPSVRDDENLSVYKDRFSGVIFLKNKTKTEEYYKEKNVSKNLNSLLIATG